MTQYSEMCSSQSRLMLAVRCGLQLGPHASELRCVVQDVLAVCSSSFKSKFEICAAADPQWQQKMSFGRFADKALLTFAYYNLDLSHLSTYVTLGALVPGDLHKLHWLSIVERVLMCPEGSMFAARYGHTDILKWLYQIGFPLHAMTGREAAFQGHLGILQLLHAAGHV
jgi:hypothetical protein